MKRQIVWEYLPVELLNSSNVITYWFADIGDGYQIKKQHQIWYGGKEATDREIKRLFGSLIEQALAGTLQEWTRTPMSTMALLLLLDQFTRNVFRGQAKAFSGDVRALSIAKWAIDQGDDNKLPVIARSFFYMPFEHSESLAAQQCSLRLFEQLLEEAPAAGKKTIGSSLAFAKRHYEIIEKFGRFPHRNAALNRQSTPAEIEYLAMKGARFGQ